MTDRTRDTPPIQEQCAGATKAGARCKAWALPGSAYCISHDPARVTDLAEWRRQGGRAKSNRNRARKAAIDGALAPVEIGAMLGKALRDVIAGTLEPNVANAAANLSRAIVAVKAATELEERIAALEASIGRRPA